MRLSFLEPLYTRPGPFASVYLDTSRDGEDPETAIALRWRHLRDDLTAQGANPASVAAVERVVGADAEVPGRHGQAIFATQGASALEGELPKPPARDFARFGMLPDTMPLVVQHAPEIPYLAAIVHYAPPTATAEGTVAVEAGARMWPLSKVTLGERLYRRVPVGEWHDAAVRLGRELGEWVWSAGADVIVLGGDTWACNVLARRLPDGLRERVARVGGPRPAGTPDVPSWSQSWTASSADAWRPATGHSWTRSSPGERGTGPRPKAWPPLSPHCNAAKSKHSFSTITPSPRFGSGSALNPPSSP